MNWRLRRATAGDASAAAMIAAASFLETFAGILDGTDIVEHCGKNSSPAKFVGWIGDPGSVVVLAGHPEGDAPVGYTLLVPPDLPIETGPADIELRRIYTLSLAKGTGLGSALMAQAIDDAQALGKSRLLLGVLGRNARACTFYERQGFTLAGERRYLVGATHHDDLIYARDLQRLGES